MDLVTPLAAIGALYLCHLACQAGLMIVAYIIKLKSK